MPVLVPDPVEPDVDAAIAPPRTLFDRIWDAHRVTDLEGGASLLYVDRHLINEVTSPQAFESLRLTGRKARRPERALAVADHNVQTTNRGRIDDPQSREQLAALAANAADFDIPYIPMDDDRQGIVHVVAPELGLTQPGMTIVCGDSHTSTHGAFGALAFGIGTSEVEHVLATQTLVQRKPKTLLVRIGGRLADGLSAKDLTLHVMRALGVSGGVGHVIEYAGPAVTALDMAGRMTLCNMSIEAGARAGLIAPDETTFAYLEGRPHAPKGAAFAVAVARWRGLRSDPDARFDRTIDLDAGDAEPLVTWGTTPATAWPLDRPLPDPTDLINADARHEAEAALAYMGLKPGQTLRGLAVDAVFIGSCTNGRIEDLRAAAAVVRDRRAAPGVRALVVPGSTGVRLQAEAEGLDRVFRDAGLQWRESGCSMCLGMNADRLAPGERCASTSNRNFEGRQGPGGRTHLMSPVMAAAAAIAGRLVAPGDLAK